MSEAHQYSLRTERKLDQQLEIHVAEERPTKKKKTRAEYQREYRQRLKQNPNLYKLHRACENERVKEYVSNLTEEKKAQYREKTRLRVKEFREKHAAEASSSKTKKAAPKTRVAKETQRKKWRIQKQNQRSEQSVQAKRREKEKRRAKYAKKKEEMSCIKTTPPQSHLSEIQSTSSGMRKAVYRAKKAMPKNSKQYAEVLTRMIHKVTPKKRQHLKEHAVITSPRSRKFLQFAQASCRNIKDTISHINMQRNTSAIHKKRVLAVALSLKRKYNYGYRKHLRKHLGLGYSLIKRAATVDDVHHLDTRKRRSDALPTGVVDKVIEFYRRGDISRDLPDARSAKKDGESVISRKVMDITLRSAYDKFNKENPGIFMGITKFKKLRPNYILTMGNNKLAQCLCERCTNIEFKLQAIMRYMAGHKLSKCAFKDKYSISRVTLCPKADGEEYKTKCLDRECQQCGVHKVKASLVEIVQRINEEISWYRWETKEFPYKGSTIKRMVKEMKTATIKSMLNELENEMAPFSRHLFNASWQWRQYDIISKDVPPNWVVFCMDYGENYSCKFQDEAQGAHWSNVQATIHPVVASYRCTEEGCTSMVTDSIMCISNDIKHCNHGVQHFNKIAIHQLEEKGVKIDKLIHFTDGASSQYKSKINFVDASLSATDFGFPTEKHFFGSRHGKGPCDREIGVLKKQATLNVTARQVEISGAFDLYSYGKENLTRPKKTGEHVHEKRQFIFVEQNTINRTRPDRINVKTLKGTQRLHSIRGTDKPYIVAYRERSCFCQTCNTGIGKCSNDDITGMWKTSNLKGMNRKTGSGDLPSRSNTNR